MSKAFTGTNNFVISHGLTGLTIFAQTEIYLQHKNYEQFFYENQLYSDSIQTCHLLPMSLTKSSSPIIWASR